MPRPTRTTAGLAWGTYCDLRRTAPGHCASCGLCAFYVHGTCTRRATRDAHVGTRMRVAMARSCRRSRACVFFTPCQRAGASVSREALKYMFDKIYVFLRLPTYISCFGSNRNVYFSRLEASEDFDPRRWGFRHLYIYILHSPTVATRGVKT